MAEQFLPAFVNHLLHALHASACFCMPLHATACYCMLLHASACFCMHCTIPLYTLRDVSVLAMISCSSCNPMLLLRSDARPVNECRMMGDFRMIILLGRAIIPQDDGVGCRKQKKTRFVHPWKYPNIPHPISILFEGLQCCLMLLCLLMLLS